MLIEHKCVPIGTNIVRKLTEGERWTPHADGGIIVVHPDRQPLWCRVSPDGCYRQDFISGTQTPTEFVMCSDNIGDIGVGLGHHELVTALRLRP